jgi:PAS domain S-box-containing protein
MGYRLNPLYSSVLADSSQTQLTPLQVAELKSVNQELRQALEQLQATQAELRQKNQALESAQQTIEQERQQLQTLLNQTYQFIGLLTPNGILQEANQSALEFVGVTLAEVVGRPFWQTPWWTHDPDQQQRLQAAIAQAASGQFVRSEFTHRSARGTIETFDFSIKPVVNHVGQVFSLVAEGRNIDDRKHMEQQLEQQVAERTTDLVQTTFSLHEEESRLRRLAATVAGMLYQYVLHPDGSDAFTYVSPRCRDIYELEPEELQRDVGQVWSMIHPDDMERVRQVNLRSAERLERFDVEFRLLPPSGCLRWVRAVSQPERQPNGNVIWDGLVLDITDQKQTAATLEKSERLYASLTEASPIGIFGFDAAGQCTYVNPRWSEMTGRPAVAAMGTGWLQTIHPDDQEPTLLAWNQWAAMGEFGTPYRNEARIVRPDGSICWIYCLILPEISSDGSVVGYIGSLTDITDRKQAELLLQQQIQREQLLTEISHEIRQSLELTEVLSLTVERIRQVLDTDRVLIFHFGTGWQGEVIMESVGEGWTPILSTTMFDPCFRDRYIELYRQGHIGTRVDITQEDLEPCYVEFLQQFQVRANLIV